MSQFSIGLASGYTQPNMCSTIVVLSVVCFISLLCLPSSNLCKRISYFQPEIINFFLSFKVHDCCTKLTTMDTTRQSLKLTHLRKSESNETLEMNPFLIRSENGNIAITLSEHFNVTNSRCYQICEYTRACCNIN